MDPIQQTVDELRPALLALAQELVRIRSYSGEEEEVIRRLEKVMHDLDFDEVRIDRMGNLLGRIGTGPETLLFDSHVDTVEVADASAWSVPPFDGELRDGLLYGRGAVDMKSAAAASIYAAVAARRLGLTEGKSVYVSCSVMEEDCDGENLAHLFDETGLQPDACVICEPSGNRIALGHKGKAQIRVRTRGVSAHGAAPERGRNAVYEMARIIPRVAAQAERLHGAGRGTLVLSRISSESASLNAVPYECEIYLDRRLAPGETEETVRAELGEITAGTEAAWETGTLRRTSWTGREIRYEPLHPPWSISPDAPLAQAAAAAFHRTFGRTPEAGDYTYWDFSTNAVTPVARGIPTIGFGPGDPAMAHMQDEHCPLEQIVEACRLYTALIGERSAHSRA
ncbi:MAG: YgeY family selenium metabolism-linked hydrolase [Spirochaetaceae bacterium]